MDVIELPVGDRSNGGGPSIWGTITLHHGNNFVIIYFIEDYTMIRDNNFEISNSRMICGPEDSLSQV